VLVISHVLDVDETPLAVVIQQVCMMLWPLHRRTVLQSTAQRCYMFSLLLMK